MPLLPGPLASSEKLIPWALGHDGGPVAGVEAGGVDAGAVRRHREEKAPSLRAPSDKIPRMARADLSDDLRRFILTSVPSVPYLEALLLLRTDPSVAWDVPRVAARLYVGERQAAEVLAALTAAGIAGSEDHGDTALFRYAPATDELRERLDALAQAYSANLVGVTDLIHSRIDKRAQQFADAFRLRKDSGKGD